jgi:flagellar motor switch protein FliN/FliY
MSNIDHEQASGLLQQNLVRHFAEAASAVLSQIAGTTLQAQPAALDTATEAATLIRIDISGALDGVCEIALSSAMTAQFAALLTGETPEPEFGVSSELREAAAELLQQICGNAADRLRAAFGPLELKPQLAGRDPAEPDPAAGARHRIHMDRDTGALEMELHILRLASQAAPAAIAPPPAQPAEPSVATTATSPATSSATQTNNRNLDLLLDIELGVTLRFGSRQMLLKDILELCSGSVVELDRRVEEPVDLLIDGRVIAQGEVVIVEGNYGLRILQVAPQGEKLACLP